MPRESSSCCPKRCPLFSLDGPRAKPINPFCCRGRRRASRHSRPKATRRIDHVRRLRLVTITLLILSPPRTNPLTARRARLHTEHADLKALLTRGVRFGYTPDVLTDAVADLSVMLALMAGRNAKETTEIVQSGHVSYSTLPRPPTHCPISDAQRPLTRLSPSSLLTVPVAQLRLVPLLLLRPPALRAHDRPLRPRLCPAHAHRRLHRLRAHRPSDARAPRPLRLRALPLHRQRAHTRRRHRGNSY